MISRGNQTGGPSIDFCTMTILAENTSELAAAFLPGAALESGRFLQYI
jgi:hypothetical protein